MVFKKVSTSKELFHFEALFISQFMSTESNKTKKNKENQLVSPTITIFGTMNPT